MRTNRIARRSTACGAQVGTHRLFTNVEFADPNTFSLQDDRHDFLGTSLPPFTYAVTTDPVSKVHDGLSKRPKSDPFIFQTDTESEFWQMKASLNVVDGRGRAVATPDNVRLYFLSTTSMAAIIHRGGSGRQGDVRERDQSALSRADAARAVDGDGLLGG
jgi:hypothetical protein